MADFQTFKKVNSQERTNLVHQIPRSKVLGKDMTHVVFKGSVVASRSLRRQKTTKSEKAWARPSGCAKVSSKKGSRALSWPIGCMQTVIWKPWYYQVQKNWLLLITLTRYWLPLYAGYVQGWPRVALSHRKPCIRVHCAHKGCNFLNTRKYYLTDQFRLMMEVSELAKTLSLIHLRKPSYFVASALYLWLPQLGHVCLPLGNYCRLKLHLWPANT